MSKDSFDIVGLIQVLSSLSMPGSHSHGFAPVSSIVLTTFPFASQIRALTFAALPYERATPSLRIWYDALTVYPESTADVIELSGMRHQ